MKSMLLAAGLGQRMRPLTLTQPKPAIPVLGRPLVLQILERLRLAGVDEVAINLHYLPDILRRLIGDGGGPAMPAVHYVDEPEILGTAGGIRNAAPLLRGDGPIVVCNSDFLSDIDLHRVLDAHRASGALATLVLAPWRPGYSEVRWDAEGRVVSLAGLPDAPASTVAGTDRADSRRPAVGHRPRRLPFARRREAPGFSSTLWVLVGVRVPGSVPRRLAAAARPAAAAVEPGVHRA
jgi:NDP-sugar pyrophosphorylase family protein